MQLPLHLTFRNVQLFRELPNSEWIGAEAVLERETPLVLDLPNLRR